MAQRTQLRKLQLKGIRSFDHNLEDGKSTIVFEPPLTVIVGRNGAGKTSLIEALRYSITGDLPLNGLTAFINDPTLHVDSETGARSRQKTDALIRVQLIDGAGTKITSTRRLTSSVAPKTKKLTGKSDEHVVVRVNPKTGEHSSISSKTANLADELTTVVGVPKAVIDNVIFCHQEDSNWPLSESKKVKETFDEIFAVDKYTKASQKCRMIAKEKSAEKKATDARVEHRHALRIEKHKLETNLHEDEESLAHIDRVLRQIDEELNPLEKESDALAQQIERLAVVDQEIVQLRAEYKQKLEHLTSLRQATVNKPLLETIEEIDRAIEELNRSTDQQQMQRLLDEVQSVEIRLRKCNEERMDLIRQQSTARATQAQHVKYREERDACLREIAAKYEIDALTAISGDKVTPICESTADEFIRAVEEHSRKLQQERQAKLVDEEKRLAELERQKFEYQRSVMRFDNTIEHERQQIERAQREIDEQNVILSSNVDASERMRCVEERITQCENALLAHLRVNDESLMEKERKEKNDALEDALEQKRIAFEEYESAAESAQQSGAAQAIEEELRRLDEELISERTRHRNDFIDAYESIYGSGGSQVADDDHIGDLLESGRASLQAALNKRRERNAALEAQIATGNTNLDAMLASKLKYAEQLHDVEQERMKLGEDASVRTVEDVKVRIAQARNLLNNEQYERDSLRGGENLLNKLRMRTERNGACALCGTHLEKAVALPRALKTMSLIIENIPDEVARSQSSIDRVQQRIDALTAFLYRLSSTAQIRQEHATISERISAEQASLQTLLKQVEEQKSAIELAEDVIERLNTVLPHAQRVQQLTEIANAKRAQLEKIPPKETSTLSLSDARKRKQEKQMAYDLTEEEFNFATMRLESARNERRRLEDEKRNAEKMLYDLREQMRSIERARVELVHLKRKVADAEVRLMDAKANGEHARDELMKVEQRLTEAKQAMYVYKDSTATAINELRERIKRMIQIQTELGNGMQVETLLRNISSALMKLEDREKALRERKQNARQKLSAIEETVKNADYRRRLLADNRHLLEYSAAVDVLQREIDSREKQYHGHSLTASREKYREVAERKRQLEQKAAIKRGERNEIEIQLRRTKMELCRPEIVNAVENYNRELIHQVVLSKVITDLELYAKAIDASVIEFHADKMRAINTLLKELWRQVYVRSNPASNDIEYIEIKTEVANETKAGNARRAYNYRVVMHVDGQDVDMRGRCSAGQKVLASILIRIALAQVFGENFKILALDEPTTNLDEDKIEMLADAMIALLEQRTSEQFQLLVITHDEKFAEYLKNGTRGGINTYRVQRNEERHTSEIVRLM